MFLTICPLLDSEKYKKRYFGGISGCGELETCNLLEVLFIRSRSVVDVISMRNNWKLRTSQCFLLYLNVDMIKMRKGSLSGAPTPPPVQHQGLSSVGSTELAVSLDLSVFWQSIPVRCRLQISSRKSPTRLDCIIPVFEV